MHRTLGVCYYPEHWPEEIWRQDASRMVQAGISRVRIGEFTWSRLEPRPGELRFDWLDRAIETLGSSGLGVVLGTPTATPPRWMLDRYPDMLPVGAGGETRGFGSRRHYCFSHDGYRRESRRIAGLLAERYGRDPRVVAWQTDNEYGCHDTALSYSRHALDAFRTWCARRYGSIEALNRAWGNVFWSMDYDRFDQLALPARTVTEPNPAHVLAFRRFSSDQVARFNRAQCDEIRKHSEALPDAGTGRASCALIFDYPSAHAWEAQPHGGDFDYFALCFDVYCAMRRAGLSIDILPPDGRDLSPYSLVMAPGLLELSPAFRGTLETCGGRVVLGPRTGQKTAELSIPTPLGPNPPGLSVTAMRVESLPPFANLPLAGGGVVTRWIETLETDAEALERTRDGRPVLVGDGRIGYLAGWPDAKALDRIVRREAAVRGLPVLDLPSGLRVRDTATHRFWINYAAEPLTCDGRTVGPADVTWEPMAG